MVARTLKKGVDSSKIALSASKDKYRVQLDFSGKNLDELEQLKDIIGASSRAEVIRDALRWLFFCAEEVALGTTIILERGEKQREVAFPFAKRQPAASVRVGAAD